MRLIVVVLVAFLTVAPSFAQTELTPDERQDLIAADERAIIDAKLRMARDQAIIARERKVGAVSGIVNKQTLHAAGSDIVRIQEQLPRLYARYRAHGGTKPLAKIVPKQGEAYKRNPFDY